MAGKHLHTTAPRQALRLLFQQACSAKFGEKMTDAALSIRVMIEELEIAISLYPKNPPKGISPEQFESGLNYLKTKLAQLKDKDPQAEAP
jgi:hypothetical protein